MPYVSRLYRDRARDLRRNQTKAERALWQILRHPNLADWHFRRQHPISPYIADFAPFGRGSSLKPMESSTGLRTGMIRSVMRSFGSAAGKSCASGTKKYRPVPDYVLSAIQSSLDPHLTSPTSCGRNNTEQKDQGVSS